ncbi:uncharacterized protein KY384_007033 [Bacidia gigantensis]|uniref:uncharacterized protein n=1 Tax=Bacidia gigantensis TaxID=2732470 RepID=UPI001D046EFC|nr:uncharacterized protein KY384_007033 [Bacidia gigantensis]KAG8528117.1 hypothetical protein KY384_007033 [Bacidia gigantensis]
MPLFRGQQQKIKRIDSTTRPSGSEKRNLGPGNDGGPNSRGPITLRSGLAPKRAADFDAKASTSGSGYQDEEMSEHSQTSEDASPSARGSRPYNTLVQSLNARGGPLQKKRKTTTLSPSPNIDIEKGLLIQSESSEEDDHASLEGIMLASSEEQADLSSGRVTASAQRMGSQKIDAIKAGKWCDGKTEKNEAWSASFKYPDIGSPENEDGTRPYAQFGPALVKDSLKSALTKVMQDLDVQLEHFASQVFNYRDILFPLRALDNSGLICRLVSLQLLNHILRTRDRVIKNNARLAREKIGIEIDARDQGFTRPTVLLVLPTRQACVRYIETLSSMRRPEQEENKKRFSDNFASGIDGVLDQKPADFQELFGGNDDDMFRLGVKFTRKTIKYFSKFYSSDLIIGSPLGLRMAIGAHGSKTYDHDFLSSIEVVIVDQADAIAMQNWEHIDYLYDHLNLQPKQAHGCDFGRVRAWYLEGHAKFGRQNIVISAFNFPSCNKLYADQMLNVAGKVRFKKLEGGIINELSISPKQTFSRVDISNLATEPDDRFNYFCSTVLPQLTKASKYRSGLAGVLIFMPSYPDFVRVRNYMESDSAAKGISVSSISEYTPAKEVSRARSHFLTGHNSVLLYTERMHHFRRYHLKGVRRVVMYGLPENPLFYKEMVEGYLSASVITGNLDLKEANVRILFSKLDMLKLERVVGSKRHLSMLQGKEGDTFDFT